PQTFGKGAFDDVARHRPFDGTSGAANAHRRTYPGFADWLPILRTHVRTYGSRDAVARDFRRGRAPHEPERELDLRPQELEQVPGAGLAADRERPGGRPADQGGPRPERERRDDVDPPADAAVDQHLEPSVDRVDD